MLTGHDRGQQSLQDAPVQIEAFPDRRGGGVGEQGLRREQGLAGLTAGNWYAVLAPAGTPAPVLDRLDRATRAVMADPGFAQQLLKLGVQVSPQAQPGDYARFLRAEMERWAPIVRSARIQAD